MGWKRPTYSDEPPHIDPDNPYKDPVALTEYRQWVLRRKLIDIEKAKLLREKLKRCYLEEGVNQQYKCRELSAKYLESIKNVGVHVANAGVYDQGREEARASLLESN